MDPKKCIEQQQSKRNPQQLLPQVPFGTAAQSAVPYELVHAVLKANNGNLNASIEVVAEGFEIQKTKKLDQHRKQ